MLACYLQINTSDADDDTIPTTGSGCDLGNIDKCDKGNMDGISQTSLRISTSTSGNANQITRPALLDRRATTKKQLQVCVMSSH